MLSPLGQLPAYNVFQRTVLLVITTCIFSPVLALAGTPLTLAETEDRALAAEPGQQALQAEAMALSARGVAAGVLPDPRLRVGLNNFPIHSGGFTTEGMTQAVIGLRQVFSAGKTRSITSHRFDFLAGALRQSAKARGRDVLSAARNAWLDLYYWEVTHDLVAESRPFFRDLASTTRSLYALGRKSQQDVLRAELELSRLDDRLIEIERQRSHAKAGLSEWIGQEALRSVARKLPSWDQLPTLGSMQATLQQHPTLQAADSQIDAHDAGVELANERRKPDWEMDFSYGYRDGTLLSGASRSDFITLGVTIGLPVFRKKAVDSRLSAALQERIAAQLSREQILRGLHSQLLAEYAKWQNLTRRLSLYDERILSQTRDHAEATLLGYQSDKGNFADVMRGYIDDLNTRIDYIRLRVERAQSYAVLANLGGFPK